MKTASLTRRRRKRRKDGWLACVRAIRLLIVICSNRLIIRIIPVIFSGTTICAKVYIRLVFHERCNDRASTVLLKKKIFRRNKYFFFLFLSLDLKIVSGGERNETRGGGIKAEGRGKEQYKKKGNVISIERYAWTLIAGAKSHGPKDLCAEGVHTRASLLLKAA